MWNSITGDEERWGYGEPTCFSVEQTGSVPADAEVLGLAQG